MGLVVSYAELECLGGNEYHALECLKGGVHLGVKGRSVGMRVVEDVMD